MTRTPLPLISRRHLAWVALLGIVSGPAGAPAYASVEALFAPGKKLWPRWVAHDEGSTARVDHSAFDGVLRRYVGHDAAGVARFAYRRVTGEDRSALRAYLAAASAVPISRCSRAEQLAYWINLYNALTIDVVLSHYPVRSILDIDISPGLFARGPWGKPLAIVEGQALTLNDIEHRILRPIWNDARLHYALNCASIGCPNLRNAAVAAGAAERVLDQAAIEYVNHPRGVRIDSGRLIVSKIYDWYQEDFGGSERGVIAHLRQYAGSGLASSLAGDSIDRYEYDWALNDAGP